MKNKSKLDYAILVFLVLLLISSLVLLISLYANSKNLPNSKDVFELFGLKTETHLSDDYIRFLDVGQGDSILISSNGETALIDAATAQNRNILYNALKSSKMQGIDLMLLTHCHDDHFGGAEYISSKFMVNNLIIPDILTTKEDTAAIKSVMANVLKDSGNCYTAVQGMNSEIGDISLTILAVFYEQQSENNRSIITMAEINGIKFLLMADAEKKADELLLKESLNLDCDVIKVAHHGSANATTDELLSASTPEYAVVSCGINNQYNHPEQELLDRLAKHKVDVYRTDLQGDITFYIKNDQLLVKTENN